MTDAAAPIPNQAISTEKENQKVDGIFVKKRNGRLDPLNLDKINKCAARACEGLESVSASEIVLDAHMQLFNKVTTAEIDKALILSARSKIEKEPAYAFAAARILANSIYKEVFGEGVDHDGFELQYKKAFIVNLKKLVKNERIDKRLLDFDLKKLANALDVNRDLKFKYLGLQTLYDRYFIHLDGRRLETPQAFWMRVAMGLAINEPNKEDMAIAFYEVMSQFLYCPSTPTLFNAGTCHPQLSSCYLSTLDDSIDGIFGLVHNQARLSKFAGGLGMDVTPIRGALSYIKGTNGKSNGLIPWVKIINDMLVAVNQGGKRKGAGCIYLETWHIDVEDFIELRKNTGDERRRAHDTNLANWIPDEFFLRIVRDDDWYLFSPSDCPDLHALFGEKFSARYAEYVEMAKAGELKNHRVVKAKVLWKKIIDMLFETGQGWVTMKDPSNMRYSNQHMGAIFSSNLCTEILLHTLATMYEEGVAKKIGETAVCNLGSMNVPEFFKTIVESDGTTKRVIDWQLLRSVVHVAMRMLNNVIDLNYYPTEEARNANLRHRPVGLGIMGFHDCLHEFGLTFESDEAKVFASKLQEIISYEAIWASSLIAERDGPYSTYKGSLWDQGKLPIDTYEDLMAYRERITGVPRPECVGPTLDWSKLREQVAKFGVRNSNMQAIAPTATISYIVGSSQSIEPDFSVLWVYSTLSGEFTMVNEYFVKRAKELGIWGPALADAIKRADGDVSLLDLPVALKTEFKNAFNVDQHKLIDIAAERQKWIDMGQSMNLYANHTSRKKLHEMYMHAWDVGLKTTYYLRTVAASRVEKSTVDKNKAFTPEEKVACSITAMKTGEVCEACQ